MNTRKSWISVQVQIERPQDRARGTVSRKRAQGTQIRVVIVKWGHSNGGPRANICIRKRDKSEPSLA